MTASQLPATILGYPRIGPNRELKRALEDYWAGRSSADELLAATADLRARDIARLRELGLTDASAIPDTSTLYDQVLDAAATFGAFPARFADLKGLDAYFASARGTATEFPLEMTKWFDTNYHYLVPEIDADTTLALTDRGLIERFTQAKADGVVTRPVIVGPVTFLALAKGTHANPEFAPLSRLDDLVAVYIELLGELVDAGVEWVQLDEPALVTDNLPTARAELIAAAEGVYKVLGAVAKRPQILLALPYGNGVPALPSVAKSGVEAIALDLVRGQLPSAEDLGGAEVTIAAGVIDGRNIWRADLEAAARKLDAVKALGVEVVPTTTTSLQHVPHSLDPEKWEGELNEWLHSWLAFADEKTREVVILARGVAEGWDAVADELKAASDALAAREVTPGVHVPEVAARLETVTQADRRREEPAVRQAAQQEKLGLPLLPTTTIGSFPQTQELRKARAAHNRGELTGEQYEERLRAEIKSVIELQEEIGLDVLVHGEAERNDMVQYFAELLDGFDVTRNGWVQSYGSRCTRPSILWGDVKRSQSLGGDYIEYAQSLTKAPVKGMLTGPVTVIAWSFPRTDIPLGTVADQIGLALRDEIADLEERGIGVIQVDEPALRELLPLDEDKHEAYLTWAVESFRLATSGVKTETQIHTHLCYSEFNQIIDALAGLDADVTSIEAARSRMEVLEDAGEAFVNAVGPGVWDIHSPRVPSQEEIENLLGLALKSLPAQKLWVNPDCGLKTRGYEETKQSLVNLVAAAKAVRATL